jgi:hypothetical protein
MDARPLTRIDCDVLVVGGGASGVAAAATAAERRLKTVLVERYGFCGGGAVAGMSGTMCGMYLARRNSTARPEKVVFGFLDRFMETLESRGGVSPPLRYGHTFTRVHDPDIWRGAADFLLAEAGVEVILHTLVTEALVDGDHVVGVRAATKQGPVEIRAAITVDASGDGDVAAMAGLEGYIGQNGHVQNPTMIFRLGNVDVEAFLKEYGKDTIMPSAVSALIAEANATGRFRLPRAKIWLFPTTRPNELLCNCTRVAGSDGRELMTLNMRDFTEAEIEGRKQATEYARFFRERLAGCEASYIIDTPPQVGVRQTRQIAGRATLTNADVLACAKSIGGIARSPWPIELHTGERPKVEWLFDDFYEVPFDCFVPTTGSGLLTAGRCLSAEHEAVASARVTAQCFSYGQAIGLAAAHALQSGIGTRDIDGRTVRDLVNRAGGRLDG